MPMPSYVNSSAYVLSGTPVVPTAGINVTFPADIVAGNLLVVQFSHANVTGAVGDIWEVTAANQDWTLGYHDWLYVDGVLGFDHYMWWKFSTGGESGNLTIKVTTIVGAAGASVCKGVMHQFANVHNPGTATFLEAANFFSGNVSGPPSALNMTTTGADRLLVQFSARAIGSTQVTTPYTGEAGGDWLLKSYSPTAVARDHMTIHTANMAVAGALTGGIIAGGTWPAAALGRSHYAYAFAPCGGAGIVSHVQHMMHHYMMVRSQHG